MSERISTKAGVFESGEKDAQGVQYKDGRLIACRNNRLEDYTVADGTEVICDRAFMNMRDLRSVTLPGSLKAIGESAFSGCKALADITIPEGVTEIRQATFRDCDSLAAIELPASVSEIEKFAFGRGLTTLVVNAPEMKIDRYAFMNARDLSTLMVPAGSAAYYRSLLADMRVKASVEEIEEPKEIFNSNNMEEEKKNKTVTVEFFGKELFLEPKDADNEEVYDAYSRYALSGFKIAVNGKEYIPIDLGIEYNVLSQEQLEECKKFDVAKFFEDSGAEEGWLYTNKACSSIEIEIPEDGEFCPNKATAVVRKFDYPDGSYDMVICIFGYDGKVYDCSPEDSNGISGKKIWSKNVVEEEDKNEEDKNNEIDELKRLPLIDIRLKEAPVDIIVNDGPFPGHEDDTEYGMIDYVHDNFKYPPVILIYHGPSGGDISAFVLSDNTDSDDATYNAQSFITDEIDREEEDEITYYQSSSVKTYGFDQDADELMGTIGVALNEYADGGNKHAYDYEWDTDVDEILVRVKFDDGDGQIFKAYSNGGIDMVDINDEQFDNLIKSVN